MVFLNIDIAIFRSLRLGGSWCLRIAEGPSVETINLCLDVADLDDITLASDKPNGFQIPDLRKRVEEIAPLANDVDESTG